jgi:hypothetical protein
MGGQPVGQEKPKGNNNDENGCAQKNVDHLTPQKESFYHKELYNF